MNFNLARSLLQAGCQCSTRLEEVGLALGRKVQLTVTSASIDETDSCGSLAVPGRISQDATLGPQKNIITIIFLNILNILIILNITNVLNITNITNITN